MLLEIDNLVVRYGAVQALKGVSLRAAEGEIVTLIGANGAGKSTLMRTLSGLIAAHSGQIRYDGKSLIGVPPHEIVALGLAPLLVREIFRTIREINQRGVTVLLVEQNAHMALSIAGRGYVLETGRVAVEDLASRLLQNEDVKKAYLGG